MQKEKTTKIFFTHNNWRGGFIKSVQIAFDALGCETYMEPNFQTSILHKILKRIPSRKLKENITNKKIDDYNKHVIEEIKNFNPDYLFTQNCGGLKPDILKKIQTHGIKTISYIVDSPYNNNRSNFAVSLRYNDFLLCPEDTWNNVLLNLAPESKIIKFFGGYEVDFFFPVDSNEITTHDKQNLEYDIVFTGNSYGKMPEGAYRAGILGQLAEDYFDVAVWGDNGWNHWFNYYPRLSNSLKDSRLDYSQFRKLLHLSKIYLNMPSPQIATSFQPRVFEIAACKGFQIISYSHDLAKIFDLDRIVTFKNYNELKEKIRYYLDNPKEREKIVNYMHHVVKYEYTFKNQIKLIAQKLNIIS